MPERVAVTYSESDKVAPYEEALRLVGLEPVRCSSGAPVELSEVAGLLLTGGSDVNPSRYGEPAHPKTETPEDDRDQMEFDLLHQAIAARVPVFAICRGLQLLNVAQGGTLQQHIEGHVMRTRNKALPAHSVSIENESQLARIAGAQQMSVNSRHHQAIGKLGKNLRATAYSEDQVIEAVELDAPGFVLAVQWHPENQAPVDERQRKLFEAFATAVGAGSVRC